MIQLLVDALPIRLLNLLLYLSDPYSFLIEILSGLSSHWGSHSCVNHLYGPLDSASLPQFKPRKPLSPPYDLNPDYSSSDFNKHWTANRRC